MKKAFLVGFLLAGLSLLAGEQYTNVSTQYMQVVISFRLDRKISQRAGIFRPIIDRTDYVAKSYGNSLSRRGGGGGTVKRVPVRKTYEEDKNLLIVGRDLSKMADNDKITLRKGQSLYRIGTHILPHGQTVAVYSFKKEDTVSQYLSTVIVCPHCGTKIPIR